MSRPSSIVTIILLVSAAHALVHLLEQSIASVEQVICLDFDLSLRESGWLGFALRLPYGIGALFAGLFADHYGEKRVIVVYLLGAGVTSALFVTANDSATVYALLFGLGSFASMYHPAGLGLLSNQTTPATRARALGIHGVFGSAGIAFAPFLAGLSIGLAVLIHRMLQPEPRDDAMTRPLAAAHPPTHSFQRLPYALLLASTSLSGVIYGGVLHFLPRYLEESGVLRGAAGDTRFSAGNFATAIALICGAVGQWAAGRLATPKRLPLQLSLVYASNIPWLVLMSWLDGSGRLVAAGLWAYFHFMNQPLYNALLAEFMPPGRRSLAFGFSNLLGFGVGAAGPYLVAQFDEMSLDYTQGYRMLAGFALFGMLLPLPLMSSRIAVRETEGLT